MGSYARFHRFRWKRIEADEVVAGRPMLTNFSQMTYRAQVLRLKRLGQMALHRYPIQVKQIFFIHHGENTTFRVLAKNGKQYLLRIHRSDYHSRNGILEELRWLDRLAKKKFQVQKIVRSKSGKLLECIQHPDVPTPRNVCVFEWVEGRFLEKSLRPHHLFELGQLIGQLHLDTKKIQVKARRYWTADGMLGKNAKFGSIDSLTGVRDKDQKRITEARKKNLKKLKALEKKFPQKCGLIHADLHFGNIISTKTGLLPIDFDDCGFGFLAYDLLIPLLSVKNVLGKRKGKQLPHFKAALLLGYQEFHPWTDADEGILRELLTARRLLMLGWLHSRSDNPRLKKHFKGAVHFTLQYLKKPSFI